MRLLEKEWLVTWIPLFFSLWWLSLETRWFFPDEKRGLTFLKDSLRWLVNLVAEFYPLYSEVSIMSDSCFFTNERPLELAWDSALELLSCLWGLCAMNTLLWGIPSRGYLGGGAKLSKAGVLLPGGLIIGWVGICLIPEDPSVCLLASSKLIFRVMLGFFWILSCSPFGTIGRTTGCGWGTILMLLPEWLAEDDRTWGW